MRQNSKDGQIFLENYRDVDIRIDSTTNENGNLTQDKLGNSLNSTLIGDQHIYKCDLFNNVPNGLLIYNDNNWMLVEDTFDYSEEDSGSVTSSIEVTDNTKYKIGVEQETQNFETTGATFSTLLGNYIFKVFLNGKETEDYGRTGNDIIFTSGLKTSNNYATIISYQVDQTISSESVNLVYKSVYKKLSILSDNIIDGSKLAGTVTTSGNNVTGSGTTFTDLKIGDYITIGSEIRTIIAIISDTELIVEGTFSTYTGSDIYVRPNLMFLNIEDFADSPNNNYYTFDSKGIKTATHIKESIDNTLSFSYHIDKDMAPATGSYNYINDKINKYLDDKFRMSKVNINHNTNFIVFYTNCRLLQAVPYSKNDEYDSYAVSIRYEDKITIESGSNVLYGDGLYGEGYYGGYLLTRE